MHTPVKAPESGILGIPLQKVGPVHVCLLGCAEPEAVSVPLATFESPLWPSVGRGAKVTREAGGLHCLVQRDVMTRSVVLRTSSAAEGHRLSQAWSTDPEIHRIVESTSRFVRLQGMEGHVAGQTLFLRLSFTTGEASGHNMVTRAADAVLAYLARTAPVTPVSVSGNLCVDKKVSAINALKGRGKSVIAEATIPREVCLRLLKTTPEKIHDLNIRKNFLGSIAAGSLLSANAHYANMLLGFFLATGQDAANIVEGSQGVTTTDLVEKGPDGPDLHCAVHLPNLVVGTTGNGKESPQVQDHLCLLGCHPGQHDTRSPWTASQRLAMLAGATVWCGELSLLAAQTNPGELMASHLRMERKQYPGQGGDVP